jgi:hypothetical protein
MELGLCRWPPADLTGGYPQGHGDKLSTVGLGFETWNETTGMDANNGAVFWMDPPATDVVSGGGSYVVAQLTLRSDFRGQASFLVQVRPPQPAAVCAHPGAWPALLEICRLTLTGKGAGGNYKPDPRRGRGRPFGRQHGQLR